MQAEPVEVFSNDGFKVRTVGLHHGGMPEAISRTRSVRERWRSDPNDIREENL